MAEINTRTDVQRAGIRYVQSGFAPVPIPKGEKGPRLRDWPKLRLSEGDISHYFPNGANIGLLLGEPNGGIVDVDLDTPEAVTLASWFLPPTETNPRAARLPCIAPMV